MRSFAKRAAFAFGASVLLATTPAQAELVNATDPATIEAEGKVAIEQQRQQFEQQKATAQMQLDAQKFQAEAQFKIKQLEVEAQLKREQMNAEIQLKREQMILQGSMAQANAVGATRFGGQVG